jgi:D-amino-acid dehydrogenase
VISVKPVFLFTRNWSTGINSISGSAKMELWLYFRTNEGYKAALKEMKLLDRSGVRGETLNGASAREIEPNLLADVVGAIRFPDDAHLEPSAFVTGVASMAQEMGLQCQTKTEVLGFRKQGLRIVEVQTTRGEFRTDLVVLAAGAWSPQISESLGLRLPIEPAKGYSLTCKRLDFPKLPLLLGEAKVAVTPMSNWLRLAGTLELAGLDLNFNMRRVRTIVTAAGRYLKGIDRLKIIEIWRGLRPRTPDGLPLLGWSERFENLIVAAGHGMIGVSLGPITGKLVAQLASEEQPLVEVTPLAPSRFA